MWERAFLVALAKSGNVTKAAAAAKITRSTAYLLKREASDFAEAWDEAIEEAGDLLELEARRRAVSGVKEPVFYQGEECGYVRKYSDTLLIFLLKGAKPEKYRERFEHTGKDGKPIEFNAIIALTAEQELDEWRKQQLVKISNTPSA